MHCPRDKLASEVARRMLMQALEAEVQAYLEGHHEVRGEEGTAMVVRNGHGRSRKVAVGAGVLDVAAPRVNDKRVIDGPTAEIQQRYSRESKAIFELLLALHLLGLSNGTFKEGLTALLGENAAGFSPR